MCAGSPACPTNTVSVDNTMLQRLPIRRRLGARIETLSLSVAVTRTHNPVTCTHSRGRRLHEQVIGADRAHVSSIR